MGSLSLRFPTQVFHLYVEYHVTSHTLEANGIFVPVGENVECNPHVLHFLGDRICPKGVPVLLVDSVSFCDRSRHLDPKFVRFLEETGAPLFH